MEEAAGGHTAACGSRGRFRRLKSTDSARAEKYFHAAEGEGASKEVQHRRAERGSWGRTVDGSALKCSFPCPARLPLLWHKAIIESCFDNSPNLNSSPTILFVVAEALFASAHSLAELDSSSSDSNTLATSTAVHLHYTPARSAGKPSRRSPNASAQLTRFLLDSRLPRASSDTFLYYICTPVSL